MSVCIYRMKGIIFEISDYVKRVIYRNLCTHSKKLLHIAIFFIIDILIYCNNGGILFTYCENDNDI